MSGQAAEGSSKRQRNIAILQKPGGVEAMSREPDSRSTWQALELLVLNTAPDRAPPPAEFHPQPADPDTAYIQRVCHKLQWELRNLADLDWPPAKKQETFLRAVAKCCWKTALERDGRYRARKPVCVDPSDLDRVPGASRETHSDEEHSPPHWWAEVDRITPSNLAKHVVLLVPWLTDSAKIDSILNDDRELDPDQIAATIECTKREAREIISILKRGIRKVERIVPRAFAKIYHRLKELASAPSEAMADVELRETLYDISRDLANSFDTQGTIAPGAKRIDKLDLDTATDLLLGEWKFADGEEQRGVLERLMTAIRQVCDALEAGDVDRAFSHSAVLVLNAARMQHHMSPSRPQVLLAYAYFLRIAGWGDAYLQANQAIADRSDAITRAKGTELVDLPPEFEKGVTLRRIKTYAALGQITWLFYHRFSTADRERFMVRDYDGLVSLLERLGDVLRNDPGAGMVYNEQLVLLAHLLRAAYNQRRTAKDTTARRRWKREEERWRTELRELLENHFLAPDQPRGDAQVMFDRIRDTAEGCAVERTLDIVMEVLHDLPQVVAEIQAERQAALAPPAQR
jgi:hypothetical protein